jgi:DNA-binding transcriptional LysR family regulator
MEPIAGMWTFVRTVEAGSLSAAARRLGRTPSSVSKSLRRLEDRLGARLLHRTTRRMQPTQVGLDLYARCRPLFDAFGEAEDRVRERRTALDGVLRVTATPALGRALLAPALVAFAREHPAVAFDVQLTGHRLDLVEAGIDVAIREGPLADSRLVATRLGDAPNVLCASPGYLGERPALRRPADLARHALLLPSATPARELRRLPAARFVVNDLYTLAELARAGCGIAALPGYVVADDLSAGRLRRVLARLPLPTSPVHAVTLDRRHQPRRTRVFLEFLTAWLRDRLR